MGSFDLIFKRLQSMRANALVGPPSTAAPRSASDCGQHFRPLAAEPQKVSRPECDQRLRRLLVSLCLLTLGFSGCKAGTLWTPEMPKFGGQPLAFGANNRTEKIKPPAMNFTPDSTDQEQIAATEQQNNRRRQIEGGSEDRLASAADPSSPGATSKRPTRSPYEVEDDDVVDSLANAAKQRLGQAEKDIDVLAQHRSNDYLSQAGLPSSNQAYRDRINESVADSPLLPSDRNGSGVADIRQIPGGPLNGARRSERNSAASDERVAALPAPPKSAGSSSAGSSAASQRGGTGGLPNLSGLSSERSLSSNSLPSLSGSSQTLPAIDRSALPDLTLAASRGSALSTSPQLPPPPIFSATSGAGTPPSRELPGAINAPTSGVSNSGGLANNSGPRLPALPEASGNSPRSNNDTSRNFASTGASAIGSVFGNETPQQASALMSEPRAAQPNLPAAGFPATGSAPQGRFRPGSTGSPSTLPSFPGVSPGSGSSESGGRYPSTSHGAFRPQVSSGAGSSGPAHPNGMICDGDKCYIPQ